ncbi:hypothetical protein [Shewanella sp.]|uniref:hypothetical protein n=1 Tax=Shewanella sp. TaxID=50422 RepID=UPI003A97A1CB
MVEIKKLITTRKGAVEDYRALGLHVDEVPSSQHQVPFGNSCNVVAEMALNVDENVLVEDEVLCIPEGEVFDFAKMKDDLLQQCSKRAIQAKWEVNVAVRIGDTVESANYIVAGSLKIAVDPSRITRFEQLFFPKGYQQSLAELQLTDAYHEINPRANVLQVLQTKRYQQPVSYYHIELADRVPKSSCAPRGENIGIDDSGLFPYD